jgi:hypothetical protein
MNPDKIMDGISKELDKALKAMAKAKNIDEKLKYSKVIKNLCKSLGVFFNLASEIMPFDDDDDDDDEKEDIPF